MFIVVSGSRFMRGLWFFSISSFCLIPICAQAVVEHSAASAGATAAAGSMNGAGKSTGGIFRGLSETIDKARNAKQGETSAAHKRSPQPIQSQKPASAGEPKQAFRRVSADAPLDPTQVTQGLDRNELMKRFGEPVMRLSEKNGSQLVESFWYNATTPGQIEIKLIDGKVAWVLPPLSEKADIPPK
jgi:hypothetical protein